MGDRRVLPSPSPSSCLDFLAAVDYGTAHLRCSLCKDFVPVTQFVFVCFPLLMGIAGREASSPVFFFMQSSSSLTLPERLCAACIPMIAVIEALIFAVAGCFQYGCGRRPGQRPGHLRFQDFVRIANETNCKRYIPS